MHRPVLHRNSCVWQVEISPGQNCYFEDEKVEGDASILHKSLKGRNLLQMEIDLAILAIKHRNWVSFMHALPLGIG